VPPIRHALILTAGLGTRLHPLTTVRAKPAIPVAGIPMIRRIIAWLAANGVDDLVLNLHHLPQTLTAIVGEGRDLSVRARYSWEPILLGSGGGPRRALPIVDADPFFIVNGDTLTDVSLDEVAAAHGATGARVTLALVPNAEPHRYGGVALDATGHVVGFPRRGADAVGSYHFIGVQIVGADVFQALPPDRPINSIPDVYDTLIAERSGAIRGYVCSAAFWDVGTTADYWRTSTALAAAGRTEPPAADSVRIAPSARVTRSILWDDVEVEAGCTIDECILTDGVRVPRGSHCARRILLRGPDGTMVATPYD
jgi:NDP-sugar pyrophosphorylase family protein